MSRAEGPVNAVADLTLSSSGHDIARVPATGDLVAGDECWVAVTGAT